MTLPSFGPDYPKAFTDADGTVMPLLRELRWARIYHHPGTRRIHRISRFLDRSATISFDELQNLWPAWTPEERQEFAQNAYWLRGQDDFPDMLRLMIRDGDRRIWQEVALSVAEMLPQEEAFGLLSDALKATEDDRGANIIQALAKTGHPSAFGIIRDRLDVIAGLPEIWAEQQRSNRLAFVAICSIKCLLELDATPSGFDSLVRSLSQHQNAATADLCRAYLRPWYPRLSDSDVN